MRNPKNINPHKVCPSGWTCLLLWYFIVIGTGVIMIGMLL